MNVAALLKQKGSGVVTAKPATALLKIASQLAEKKIGAVVVVGDGGSVDGIVSERDVVQAISMHGEGALTLVARDIMTSNVTTCEKSNTIEDLMNLMTKGRFRHLPVVEDDALVGIISIGDVVRNHIAEVEMEVSAMRCYLATG